MSLPIHVINDVFAVAGQLSAQDMQDVVHAGYKSVIINRPDYEGGSDQPVSADVVQAAKDLGLQVEYQPVISGALTRDDAVRFAALLEQMPKPVLAYCRSGGRCLSLYTAATEL